MRFERKGPDGLYSVTVRFVKDQDPEELMVIIGFRPQGRSEDIFRYTFYLLAVDRTYIPYCGTLSRVGNVVPRVSLRRLSAPVSRCVARFLDGSSCQNPVRIISVPKDDWSDCPVKKD